MEKRLPEIRILAVSAVNSAGKPCPASLFGGACLFDCSLGTEELAHLEIVGTIVHQLTRNISDQDARAAGFAPYFVDHTTGVYPQFASGTPWTASTIAVKGDVICDLTEDLAADGAILQAQQPI